MVAGLGEQGHVAGQRGRVAGDVDHPGRASGAQRGDRRAAQRRPRRVGHHDVRARPGSDASTVLDRGPPPPHLRQVGQRGAPAETACRADSTTAHPARRARPARPARRRTARRRRRGPRPCRRRGAAPSPTTATARRRQRRVHLPERARDSATPGPAAARAPSRRGPARAVEPAGCTVPSSPVGVDRHLDLVAGGEPAARAPAASSPAGAIGQSSTAATSWERWRRRPARPRRRRRTAPGCASPAGPPGSASTGRRPTSHARPAAQLLAHHRGLQRALRVGASRAASRSRRTGPARHGQGGSTRSGDAVEHRDRVGPAERRAAVLGDDRATTRSPGSACRTNTTRPVVPGDAVPAVGDRRRRAARARGPVQSRPPARPPRVHGAAARRAGVTIAAARPGRSPARPSGEPRSRSAGGGRRRGRRRSARGAGG